MAWLQNLAGRAEDFLNKIDQNAATVLNEGSQKLSGAKRMSVVEILNEHDEMETVPKVNLPSRSSSSPNSPAKLQEQTAGLNVSEEIKIDNVENVPTNNSEKLNQNESASCYLHNSFILSEDAKYYNEKIKTIETENCDLRKQLLYMQHKYLELRNDNDNMKIQHENVKSLLASAQTEMEQYRSRAQRILQEKEQLLSLKNMDVTDDLDYQMLKNCNNDLKKELEFQQECNRDLLQKLEKNKNEINLLHFQLASVQNTLQQSNDILQSKLNNEKEMRQAAEDDCRIKIGEINSRFNELAEQYQNIKEKDEEIAHLKNLLKQRNKANIKEELETRMKSLTDTLMKKQNTIETITTEKNALRIQLEKLTTECQNKLAQQQCAHVRIININELDEVRSQVPQFMRVSPLDAGVTRRVKHAYSTVDAISIKIALFLRRYPIARVSVFCYIILLQLWVLLVLFWYAPSTRQ